MYVVIDKSALQEEDSVCMKAPRVAEVCILTLAAECKFELYIPKEVLSEWFGGREVLLARALGHLAKAVISTEEFGIKSLDKIAQKIGPYMGDILLSILRKKKLALEQCPKMYLEKLKGRLKEEDAYYVCLAISLKNRRDSNVALLTCDGEMRKVALSEGIPVYNPEEFCKEKVQIHISSKPPALRR